MILRKRKKEYLNLKKVHQNNRSVGVSPPPKYYAPIPKSEQEEISDEVPLPDFNNSLAITKNKSFKANCINDQLEGKSKRFSVMKIMPDSIKSKARETALSISKTLFLENGK